MEIGLTKNYNNFSTRRRFSITPTILLYPSWIRENAYPQTSFCSLRGLDIIFGVDPSLCCYGPERENRDRTCPRDGVRGFHFTVLGKRLERRHYNTQSEAQSYSPTPEQTAETPKIGRFLPYYLRT